MISKINIQQGKLGFSEPSFLHHRPADAYSLQTKSEVQGFSLHLTAVRCGDGTLRTKLQMFMVRKLIWEGFPAGFNNTFYYPSLKFKNGKEEKV